MMKLFGLKYKIVMATICGVIYRHPNDNLDGFLQYLYNLTLFDKDVNLSKIRKIWANGRDVIDYVTADCEMLEWSKKYIINIEL